MANALSDNADLSRLKSILNLADTINDRLSRRQEITSALSHELEQSLNNDLPLVRPSHIGTYSDRLEHLGCTLWNASIRVLHDTNQAKTARAEKFIATLRAFAFTLLQLAPPASESGPRSNDLIIRNLKIGLRAAKYALDLREPELGLRVLETCSASIDCNGNQSTAILYEANANDEQNGRALRLLRVTYYLLRIQHASTIDHWDMAEHFFSKMQSIDLPPDNDIAGQASQLFYLCGSTLLATGRRDPAIKWLQRAIAIVSLVHHGEHQDVRIAATARLVTTLLQDGSQESLTQAWELLHDVDTYDIPSQRLHLIRLQVEVILATEPVRKDLLKQAIIQAIQSELDKDSFTTIIKLIHKIRPYDSTSAETALESLLTKRLLPVKDSLALEQQIQWIEVAVVTLTFLLLDEAHTSSPTSRCTLLCTVMDVISANVEVVLSAKAVHAVQTLIWKQLNHQDTEAALPWLKSIQHDLLSNVGSSNQTCLQRKAIQLQLASDQINEARATFFTMYETARNEPLSRYLAFKIALRQRDQQWAAENLACIVKSDPRSSLLHACAVEAQTSSSRASTLSALEAIAASTPNAEISPALLRCLARLHIGEVEALADKSPAMTAAVAVCERYVLIMAQQHPPAVELQWWSRNSYNIALRWGEIADADIVVRLLKVCTAVSSMPFEHEGPIERQEREEKLLVSHFLIVTASIVRARKSDGLQSQCYLEARSHIRAYLKLWQAIGSDESAASLPAQRAFELHRFELEAICKLKQWQDLDTALDRCLSFPNVAPWQKLADVVLIVHKELASVSEHEQNSHTPKILDILQHIVNDTWRKDKNVTNAARWVRVAFSIDASALGTGHSDGKMAFKLLSQAADIARRSKQTASARYPDDELQWLASVAFNHGIDACIAVRKELAWKWFEAALELARHADDNGALLACLTSRQAAAEAYLDKASR